MVYSSEYVSYKKKVKQFFKLLKYLKIVIDFCIKNVFIVLGINVQRPWRFI